MFWGGSGRLTVVGLINNEGAVQIGITEGSILPIHVVTASESTLAIPARRQGRRRAPGAGRDLPPLSPGEDGGGDVVGSGVLDGGGAVDGGDGGGVGGGGLALVVDGDPGGGLFGALLNHDEVAFDERV